MMYDLLFGQGIKGGGTIKKLIMNHKNSLTTTLARLKIKAKAKDNKELLPEQYRNPSKQLILILFATSNSNSVLDFFNV